MKTVLLTFCIAFSTCVFAATDESKSQQLVPLKQIAATLDFGKPDPAQIAYIGNRSAALYAVIAQCLESNPRNKGDLEAATKMKEKAAIFDSVGRMIGFVVNKTSTDFREKQIKLILDIYTASILESRAINNTIFSPLISEDFDTANSLYPYFAEMKKKLDETLKSP